MNFFTKEVKIALAAIVGIVVLFFGMNFLKGKSLFSSDRVYFAKFTNISGLTASSPIFANGFKVGTVKAIDPERQKIKLVVEMFGRETSVELDFVEVQRL